MIDFDRFWIEANSPYEAEDDDETDAEVPPGVAPGEVLAWERAYGVTLPEPIRTALGLRNGGYVRNTSVKVLPLDEIVPVDDDFWEYTEVDEADAPDHGLMFVFGDETMSGGTFLLNFNAKGPEGVPSVYIDHHGESTYLVSDSIVGFFDAELASADAPSVDWSEAEASPVVVARETIDLSALHDGMPASEDQVLVRAGEALVLFVRSRSPEGEELSRTTLPLPLDSLWAQIQPRRPAPNATFSLHLQPEETDGIVEAESKRNDDGRWKNSTSRGVPICVMFESTDRDRLEALRTELFGAEASARGRAQEDRQAALQATLGTLTPDQRTAAMLEHAMKLREETHRQVAEQFGDLGAVPPELADAMAMMRQRMEAMAAMVRQRAAANPADPDTLRQIEELYRRPDPK